MPVRTRRTGWVYTTVISWRGVFQRFSFAFLLSLSLGLLVVGYSKPVIVQNFRARAVDAIALVFDALSRPLEMINAFSLRVNSYRGLLKENENLKKEIATLSKWQNAALVFHNENKEFRSLLHYKAEPSLSYVSARVIADTGGAFVRSLVVTAGNVDGVREGMAALTGDGLVGRVVEIGEWTSRLLLITDLNSRIPVMILGTDGHAVMAGDNSPHPKILYLPQEIDVKVGARVVTSGHGGIFPPNVPVGVISAVKGRTIEIVPTAALGRINQIRLIDFGLAGGNVNPLAANLKTSKSQ